MIHATNRSAARNRNRASGSLHSRMSTFAATLILTALTATAAAADTDDACEPTKVQEWPICSPKTMNAATSRYEGMFQHMKAGAFAREYESPLPGRARMNLSGVVSAGGVSCVSHVAVESQDSVALRSPRRQRKQKTAAGETNPDRVVFHIYTPQTDLQQVGYTVSAFAFEHGGLGGWQPNSGGNLKIYLPETSPGELVAGESYPAFALAKGEGVLANKGWLYTDWQGQKQPVYYDGTGAAPACKSAQKGLNRLYANAGIETLEGGPDWDCRIKDIAFAGNKRHVTGYLEGRVFIDAITNGNVAGHFDLSGRAQLTRQDLAFRYDPTNGHLRGDHKTNESEFGGQLQATGRFNAPNYVPGRYVHPGRTVVVSGDDVPREENRLHIRSHLPRLEQRNVDWDEPGIRVTFDRQVDLRSLDDDSFYLEYRDGNRQLQKVPVSYARPGPQTIRLVPSAELKDGVRYRVQIKAGSDGVQGSLGELLDVSYSWNFYTTINLDDREPMPDLEKIYDKTEGIEPHVFQVSRDTKLVPGKPTLARVYVKWNKREDVAEDWQVERFLARVQIRSGGPKGPVIASKKDVVIRRFDLYDASDKRFADNSVNLFNLDVSGKPKNIVAEVRPKAECETAPRKFLSAGHAIPGYVDNPKSLTLAYYLIKPMRKQDDLGFSDKNYWTDGIPDRAKVDAAIIARKGANFTLQNFPLRDVNTIYGGGIAIGIGLATTENNGVGRSWVPNQHNELGGEYTQQVIEARAYTALMAWRDESDPVAQSADIFMLFLPPGTAGAVGKGAYAPRAIKPGKPGMIDIWLDNQPSGTQYISKHIVDVAHETGHVFGLGHSDRVLQGPPAPYRHPNGGCEDGGPAGFIEGFRIALDGNSGQNKSAVEGNGSSQGSGKMYPLMVCGQTPVEGTFIADKSYHYLIDQIQAVAQNDWLGNRVLLAANGPVTARLEESWAVSGFAERDGTAAFVDGVTPMGWQKPARAGHGEFKAVLEDAGGQALATRNFAVESSPAGVEASTIGSFRLRLPRRTEAKTIAIRHGGKTIQRYTRSAHPPTLSELAAKADPNGVVTVSWKGHDADGDKLAYDVYYTANGTDFHPRAIGLRADHFNLSPKDSFPGENPQVRVVASDGFDQTSDTIALSGHGAFSVLVTLPRDTYRQAAGGRIEAAFNADLAPHTLNNNTFTLKGADGQPVKAVIKYRSTDHTAILIPNQPLAPAMRYTATLSADIADRYGDTLGEPASWQFTSQRSPKTPSEHADTADASETAKPSDKRVPTSDTSSDNAGKGWLELAGARRDFEIAECKQTNNDHSGHTVYVRGAGADGLSVTARVHAWPDKPPTQQVVVHDARTIYQLSVHKTDEGWAGNDDKPVDGPLINIRDGRLAVDADLEINLGGEGHKHVRIQATCPALAANANE